MSDDCISREDAIRIASGYCHWSRVPEELAKLPSVKPKERTGEWLNGELIPNDINGHWQAECSRCGRVRIVDNFCPNCGAKMEKGERG